MLDSNGADLAQFDGGLLFRVTSHYLDTIGTPLVQGRGFTAEEANAKAPVVIVSESAARNLWPNENPLGKTFRVERTLRAGTEIVFPTVQVIGVAHDNQIHRPGYTPPLLVYAPSILEGGMETTLAVRTRRDAASLKAQIRKAALGLEPVLRLSVSTMEEDIA